MAQTITLNTSSLINAPSAITGVPEHLQDDIWSEDKELLQECISLNLTDSSRPTLDDIVFLDNLKFRAVGDKKEALEYKSLVEKANSMMEHLIPILEKEWSYTLSNKPSLEIIPHYRYGNYVMSLDREEMERIGLKSNRISPSSSLYFPHKNLIVISGMNNKPAPNGSSHLCPWNEGILNFAIADSLNHAFMANVRKETGLQSNARLLSPQELRPMIDCLGIALSQAIQEKISPQGSTRALYSIANKAILFWHHSQGQNKRLSAYAGVRVLSSRGKNFAQIACADYLVFSGNELICGFYERHPFHQDKKRFFETGQAQ